MGQIASQPAGQSCSLTDATGTIAHADAAVAVNCVDAVATLALDLADQRTYARYGEVVDYVVTLTNNGNATAHVTVTSNASGGYLPASQSWQCLGGGAGSHCTIGSGAGAIATEATLAAGSALHFLVSIPVSPSAPDGEATLQVATSGNAVAQAVDSNILVLLRDGFETGGLPWVAGAAGNCGVLAASSNLQLSLPAAAATAFEQPWRARSASGHVLVLEHATAGAAWWRLVAIAPDGARRVSAWVMADGGSRLGLSLREAAGAAWLQLDGGRDTLALPLTAPAGTRYASTAGTRH